MRDMRLWLDRFVTVCLYGILFVPLVFEQRLMHPLVISKTLFFQVLIEFACAGYIVLAVFHKEYRPRITPILLGVLALFGAIIISGVFSVDGWRSIWSVPDRMTGIILMAHLVAYFVILVGMPSFSWWRYSIASVGISFFTALFPVIQLIVPAIFFDRLGSRLSGTIGNPIFLAAYLFPHVFLAGLLAERSYNDGKRFWPYALIAAFDLIVIILTETRGAFIAMIVSFAVISVYVALETQNKRIRHAVFVIWIILTLFAGAFWVTRANPLWQSVPILSRIARDGFHAENRLIAWRAGLTSFIEHPVTGVGWDNFYAAFNAHYDPRLLRSGFTETFFDRPHNVFIQFLAETGIIGFIAYLFLLGCAFYSTRKNKWLFALLAAYVVQNFFAFDSVSSYVIFFMVLAFTHAEQKVGGSNLRLPARFLRAEPYAMAGLTLIACFGIYFFNYRPYTASNLEWTSINYFVHGEIPEGLEYMEYALAASTPYHRHIGKDLYPNIALIYKQDLPLPDVRNLIASVVRGMTEVAKAEPLNYGFWIGLADMMPPIASLDPAYISQGLVAVERADAISPRRQATEYVRAKLLNLKGDKAGSLAAMARAIALDPEVGDAHFYYALLLLESGDGGGGARELARASALGREPRSAAEASVAAAQLGDLEMYKESTLYFQKALLMKPDDAELMMKLGLVYYFSGDKSAARRYIAKVMEQQDLKKSPQYTSLHLILIDLGLEK